jgi:ubiquinone/menaquinone biosynthesis C-methylase UbiE
MVKKESKRIAFSKFQEAQKSEREYWKRMRERILSEEYRTEKRIVAQEIIEELRASTNNGRLDRLLEIGGGADPMVEYFNGHIGITIDPLASFYKLEIAHAPLNAVEYFQGIGENLPFKKASFDCVLMYNCIDHGLEPFKILDEGRRVLRRGGSLHLLLNTYSHKYALYSKFIDRIVPTHEDKKHPHCLGFNSVKNYIKKIGFVEINDHHDDHPYSRIMKESTEPNYNFIKDMFKGHRTLRAIYRLETPQ